MEEEENKRIPDEETTLAEVEVVEEKETEETE